MSARAPAAVARTPSQLVTSMISIDSIMPSVGDRTIATSVLLRPLHWTPVRPACATPAPDHPADQRVARRGRDALEPGHDVPEHRADQARRRRPPGVTRSLSMMPLPIVSATRCSSGTASDEEIGREVEEGRERDRGDRASAAASRPPSRSSSPHRADRSGNRTPARSGSGRPAAERRARACCSPMRGRSRGRRSGWRHPRTRPSPAPDA